MNTEKEVMENVEQKQEEQPQGKLVAVSRRYYINQEFSDKLAKDFCEWIDDVVEFDELWVEQYPEQPLLPVVITISSRGGVVDSLNQMLDALDDLKCPIITEIRGFAYSCAMFLFARGDIRIAGRNARIMYHQILYGADGNLQEHKENYNESVRLMKNIDALIVERTEIPQKVLDKVKREKRDWFMTREECLKYNHCSKEQRERCRLAHQKISEDLIKMRCSLLLEKLGFDSKIVEYNFDEYGSLELKNIDLKSIETKKSKKYLPKECYNNLIPFVTYYDSFSIRSNSHIHALNGISNLDFCKFVLQN